MHHLRDANWKGCTVFPAHMPYESFIYILQSSGTAKPSLVGKLLDEYDAEGAADPEHEHDLKVVGAVMYGGEHWH